MPSRADDLANLDLTPVRMLAVQHNQTLKTFDTYSRDVLFAVTGKTNYDGHPSPYVILDMAFRPEPYAKANLLYIRNKPFRKDFEDLTMIDAVEKARIIKEGTISLNFWLQPGVQAAMEKIESVSTIKATAIQQINGAAATLANLIGFPGDQRALDNLAILPPLSAGTANAAPWATPHQLIDAVQSAMAAGHNADGSPATQPTAFAGYSPETTKAVITDLQAASDAWRAGDAGKAGDALTALAGAAHDANPALYPSAAKRRFELLYNGLYRLTLPGAMLYFVGFVLFLLAWKSEVRWLYRSAVVFTLLAWLTHATSIGVRWWLVENAVGNWFESIPIKNQFESVLMSAFFGVTIALLLERWKRLGIFGAAAACVGMLSLVAIFAAPYVTGRDIGGEIHQNAGILMTYWLYVHVTMVTASYALIGMTFVMGIWYCVQYVKNRDAAVLKTIDDCNLVMLQLAFWILGSGIIAGAMWADVSWGRPWGWDPKETFALITWIVYLIIIHVRFVTAGQTRALTTGVLSIVGFGVMLFNWIGVNFYLVGLHSYA